MDGGSDYRRKEVDYMRQDPNRALEWTKVYPAQRASIANLSLADAGRLFLLILYCAEKVNGGVIEGARKWTRKQWRNELHFDEILTKNQPNFWHFSQENLIVDAYDAEAENAAISKRERNSNNANRRWERICDRNAESEKEIEIEKDTFNFVDAASESESESYGAQARGGDVDIDFDASPADENEVLAYMTSLSPDWAGKEPELFASMAHDFFNVGNYFSGNDWRDKARKYLNEKWVQEHRQQKTPPLPHPKRWDEVLDFLRSLGNECPIKDEKQMQECAWAFFMDNEAIGWVAGTKDGKIEPIANWKGRARNYAASWQAKL